MDIIIPEIPVETLPDGSYKINILTDTGQDLSFSFSHFDFESVAREIEDKYIMPVLNDPKADKDKLAELFVFTSFMLIFRQYRPWPPAILNDIDYVKLAEEVTQLKVMRSIKGRDVSRLTFFTDGRYEPITPKKIFRRGKWEEVILNYRPGEEEILKVLDRLILKLSARDIEDIDKSLSSEGYNRFKNNILKEIGNSKEEIQKKYPNFTPETEEAIENGIGDILNKHREEGYINLLLIEAYFRYLDHFSALARYRYKQIKKDLNYQQKALTRILYFKDYPVFGKPPRHPFGSYIPLYTEPLSASIRADQDILKLFIKVVLYPRLKWEEEREDLKRRFKERFTEILHRKDMIRWLKGDAESLDEWKKVIRKETTEKKIKGKKSRVYEKKITKSLNYPVINEEGDTVEYGDMLPNEMGLYAENSDTSEEKGKLEALKKKLDDIEGKIYDLIKQNPDIIQVDIANKLNINQTAVSRAIDSIRQKYKLP